MLRYDRVEERINEYAYILRHKFCTFVDDGGALEAMEMISHKHMYWLSATYSSLVYDVLSIFCAYRTVFLLKTYFRNGTDFQPNFSGTKF